MYLACYFPVPFGSIIVPKLYIHVDASEFSTRLSSRAPLARLRVKTFIIIIFCCNLFSSSNDIECLIGIMNFVEGLFARSPIVLCSHAP